MHASPRPSAAGPRRKVEAPRPGGIGRHLRRFRPRTRGQALVEFALIAPVLIVLFAIAIDFGRLFFSYVEVTNAAREAAAYVAADPTVSQSSINARAGQEANTQAQIGEGGLTVSAPVCQTTAMPPVGVSCSTAAANKAGTGNQVTIAVSRPFTFLTPVIGGFFGTLTMSASATSPVYNAPPPPPTPTPTPDPCTLSADFTFDQSKRNKPVVFDASDSTPQSGACKISAYAWKWDDSSPPSGTYDITGLTSPSQSHSFPSQGQTYWVTLRVSSSSGTAVFQQPVLTLSK